MYTLKCVCKLSFYIKISEIYHMLGTFGVLNI